MCYLLTSFSTFRVMDTFATMLIIPGKWLVSFRLKKPIYSAVVSVTRSLCNFFCSAQTEMLINKILSFHRSFFHIICCIIISFLCPSYNITWKVTIMIRLISFRDYALGRTLATSYHKHNYITEGNVVLCSTYKVVGHSVFCLVSWSGGLPRWGE